MKKLLVSLSVALSLTVVQADEHAKPKLSKEQAMRLMKSSMQLLSPPLKKTIGKLSKKTKGVLVGIYRHHDRHSLQATLSQVMNEVTHDYKGMIDGILRDNPEMTADSARRLANHRIPRGGLISYLKLDQINDGMLAGLDDMNSLVEGNALKLAVAAESGDMVAAAGYLTKITTGCVTCHNVFRGKPGKNKNIRYDK